MGCLASPLVEAGEQTSCGQQKPCSDKREGTDALSAPEMNDHVSDCTEHFESCAGNHDACGDTRLDVPKLTSADHHGCHSEIGDGVIDQKGTVFGEQSSRVTAEQHMPQSLSGDSYDLGSQSGNDQRTGSHPGIPMQSVGTQ